MRDTFTLMVIAILVCLGCMSGLSWYHRNKNTLYLKVAESALEMTIRQARQ